MKLLVPAYGYPAEVPHVWKGLVDAAPRIAAVIVNPANGVGPRPDPVWARQVQTLKSANIQMAGYVDSTWGRRTHAEIALEARRYQLWYGIDWLFVDCLHSQDSEAAATLVATLRSIGIAKVIGNAGTQTHAGVARHLDVLVEHEGFYAPPVQPATPDAPDRCWIIHDLDWPQAVSAIGLARESNVAFIWVTDGTGPNPYGNLPSYWRDLLAEISPDS
jgi:hypothetical protein